MVERFWSLNGDRPMVGWAQSLYRLLWQSRKRLLKLYVVQTPSYSRKVQTIKRATLRRKKLRFEPKNLKNFGFCGLVVCTKSLRIFTVRLRCCSNS